MGNIISACPTSKDLIKQLIVVADLILSWWPVNGPRFTRELEHVAQFPQFET
jgi:hypothetical protein